MRLRVLLASEAAADREHLNALLRREPDLDLAGECTTALELFLAIQSLAPDLVFLDAGMSALALTDLMLWAASPSAPGIVVLSRGEETVLRALEGTGLPYLLMPVVADKLHRVLALCRARRRDPRSAPPSPGAADFPGRFLVNTARGLSFVRVQDIDWIEAAGNYLRLRVGGDAYLIRQTMTGVERLLDPERFARIHRCSVVNVERIVEVLAQRSRELRVRLCDGTVLGVSRTFRGRLGTILGARRRSESPAGTARGGASVRAAAGVSAAARGSAGGR